MAGFRVVSVQEGRMSTFARPTTLRPSGKVAVSAGACLAASLVLALMIVALGAGRDGGTVPVGVAAPAEHAARMPIRRVADRGEPPQPADSTAEGARHRVLMMLYLQATSRDGIWSRR
jgi:hypothetical protein